MTDDPDATRDDAIDGAIDDADLEAVTAALAGLDFLRPDAPAEPDVAMPDDVWARLQSALAAERPVAPASDATATVIPLERRSRATRWAGGLVAASVAVLAVGVGVTAFRGSGGDAVVAGEIVAASAMSVPSGPAAGLTKAAPSAAAAEAAPADDLLTTPGQLSFAGMVPPALRLVGSDTDYTRTGLRSQVSAVLDRIGLAPEQAEPAMLEQAPETVVMEGMEPAGFLSSAESLRDCITKLTRDADSTALMVDMSTYEGEQAGVVVAPDYPGTATEPDLTELEVWVVDPECDRPLQALRIEIAP